jgi:uncharacterized protein (TIGR01244 family)
MLESIKNFRRVDEQLLTSGQPSEAQLATVAAHGVEVVINLALHDDPRYSLSDEPGLVASLGLDYVHIPVQFAQPTEQDLRAFFDAMDANRGRHMLVHCAANLRVSAFLGLYGAIREQRDRDDAFALMHGLWEPNEVWADFIEQMLSNKALAGRA